MRKETNVGVVERVGRVAGGGLLTVLGIFFLVSGGGSLALVIVELAGIALGLDFVFTGLTGYCPLYHMLGWTKSSGANSRVSSGGNIGLGTGH